MKAVVFLRMGTEVLNCLSLDDIVQFSACCIFCDQLFLDGEVVKALVYPEPRLQSLLPLFSLTFASESTLGVIRKLVHRISRENITRERTLSLKSKVSDFAAKFLRDNPAVCPTIWREDEGAGLLEGMVKAGEDRIVLIVRSSSIAEQERVSIIDPALEKTAADDEYNDFQPHRRNNRPSPSVGLRQGRGKSYSFCSSDELEDYAHTVLRGFGSLSELELWSLGNVSQRASGTQSPPLSREPSPRRTSPPAAALGLTTRRQSPGPRRDRLLSPIDMEEDGSDEGMRENMRLSDLNRLLPNQ